MFKSTIEVIRTAAGLTIIQSTSDGQGGPVSVDTINVPHRCKKHVERSEQLREILVTIEGIRCPAATAEFTYEHDGDDGF
jgi:hypothetical protein